MFQPIINYRTVLLCYFCVDVMRRNETRRAIYDLTILRYVVYAIKKPHFHPFFTKEYFFLTIMFCLSNKNNRMWNWCCFSDCCMCKEYFLRLLSVSGDPMIFGNFSSSGKFLRYLRIPFLFKLATDDELTLGGPIFIYGSPKMSTTEMHCPQTCNILH